MNTLWDFTREQINQIIDQLDVYIGGISIGDESLFQFHYKNMANEPKIDLDNPWTPVQEVITCNPELASFNKDPKESELLMHEVMPIF